MNRFFIFGVSAMLLVTPAVWADEVDSLEPTVPESRTVRIDENTLKKGVMIGSRHGEVIVAIGPRSLIAPTVFQMNFELIDSATVPEHWQSVRSWQVNLAWDVEGGMDEIEPVNSTTPASKKVSQQRPRMQLLLPMARREYVPIIARWDDVRLRWIPLPTKIRWQHDEAIAALDNSGIYALFEDQKHHLTGKATWYPDRLSKDSAIAAASNEYPLRTKLKVTNAQTHESVIVRVVSVGPFVKGRIIDLTKSAFSKIGYPRKQGVLEVMVEAIDNK